MSVDNLGPWFPTEIWELIFAKFSDQLHHDVDWSSCHSLPWDLSTIQNLRLVSRTFNYLVSPLLCPYLRLDISYESVDRFKTLLRNPRIASGLRGIELSLAYRPEDFVHDRARYSNYWEEKLKRISDMLDEELELKVEPDRKEDDPELYLKFVVSDEHDALLKGLRYFWDRWARESRSYYRLIRNSYARYRRSHFEQFGLLIDGSFVRQLAAAIGCVGRPVALHLTDEVWGTHGVFEPDNHHLFLDRTKLSDDMAQPQAWTGIRRGLLPARVLTELPIAIAEAGGWLQNLKISCMPDPSSSHSIFPPGVSPKRTWEMLRDALARIEVFDFGDGGYICAYTSAVLFSRRLRHLAIVKDTCRYRGRVCRGDLCKSEACLPQRTGSTITKLCIAQAKLTQGKMERMCKMLSPKCKRLWLSSVTLEGVVGLGQ